MFFKYKEFQLIPEYNKFKKIDPISIHETVRKYHIYLWRKKERLLVIYTDFYQKEDFYRIDLHAQLRESNIPTNDLISCGLCSDHLDFFMLYDWLEGEDLSGVISGLSETEQYRLGIQSGKILKRVHSLSLIYNEKPVKKSSEIEALIRKYENDPVCMEKYPCIKVFVDFLKESNHKDQERYVFLHGDYNINNLIYNKGELSIIDWVYGRAGEPWEDFTGNIVNAQISPFFAMGQIDGYFDHKVPDEFWKELSVFTAAHQLELLDKDLNEELIVNQHEYTMKEYCNMSETIPCYYKDREKIILS